MKNDTNFRSPCEVSEVRWRALPGLLGGLAGLSGLVIAILVGLQTDNAAGTILGRAVIAMGGCWIAGWAGGLVIRRAVHADSVTDCPEDSGDPAISDDSGELAHSSSDSSLAREAA